jgi:hypothetical protein
MSGCCGLNIVQLGGGGGGTVYTASNGLTLAGTVFQLGGALTLPTIITTGANTLTIQAAGGQTIDNAASITVNNNRGVSIQGVSTTEWVTISNT